MGKVDISGRRSAIALRLAVSEAGSKDLVCKLSELDGLEAWDNAILGKSAGQPVSPVRTLPIHHRTAIAVLMQTGSKFKIALDGFGQILAWGFTAVAVDPGHVQSRFVKRNFDKYFACDIEGLLTETSPETFALPVSSLKEASQRVSGQIILPLEQCYDRLNRIIAELPDEKFLDPVILEQFIFGCRIKQVIAAYAGSMQAVMNYMVKNSAWQHCERLRKDN